jgi:ferredoxin-nitrate reductase
MWGEKEGTMENADRTINLLRKAVDPPQGAKTDFEILLDFSRRMGFKDMDGNPLLQYTAPEQCFEEWKIVSVGTSADMSGITYEKLKMHNGLRYPVNEEHPLGTVRLYEDFRFHTNVDETQSWGRDLFTGRAHTREEYESLQANGRAIFHPLTYIPPAESPTPEYPLWITTGRLVWHWHSRTKTGRVPQLHMAAPQGYIEINKKDADKLLILPGEVVRVVSPRGWIEVPARIVDTVQPGLVFVPFHYGSWQQHQAANELTVDLADPVSKQPTFKQSSCRIEKIRQKVIVQPGDTLSSIAGKYGLTDEQLAAINKMIPPFRADIGKEIEVPLSMVDVVIPPYMLHRDVSIFPKF